LRDFALWKFGSDQSKIIRSRSGFESGDAVLGVSGWKDDEEVEEEGTKTLNRKEKRVPPPIPNHRALSQSLLNKDRSAICD
jgi:hypothetical protein